jgi:peptidoglycan/xylan/chitin deacetylase (PgdA/CDA1 family)
MGLAISCTSNDTTSLSDDHSARAESKADAVSIREGQVFPRLWRLARRRILRYVKPHALVLMYHRVSATEPDPWKLCVTPGNFRQHIEALSRFADVIPLQQLRTHLRSRRAHRPAVAITFDDGYVDNLTEALPILQRFDAPATVFIATGWIGRSEPFWWDQLLRLILGCPQLPSRLDLRIGAREFRWQRSAAASNGSSREALHAALWSRLKLADEGDRNKALARLCEQLPLVPQAGDTARAMNHDELLRLANASLIEIGAHTERHCSLPSLSAQQQKDEILGSKRRCEDLLGRTPVSFAYPYGAFDRNSRALVAAAGFAQACCTVRDLVWRSGDPLLIPRFAVSNCDGDLFERRVRSKWL